PRGARARARRHRHPHVRRPGRRRRRRRPRARRGHAALRPGPPRRPRAALLPRRVRRARRLAGPRGLRMNLDAIPPARAALVARGAALTYGDLAAHVRTAPTPDPRLVAHPTLDAILALHTLIARRVPAVLLHPRLTAADAPPPPPPGAVPEGTLAVVYTSG